MAYARVTLANIRTQLLAQLGSTGSFWISQELDRVINEVISVWQALTGDRVITITQTIPNTTGNILTIRTDHTNGAMLSALRVSPTTSTSIPSGDSWREMSVPELDKGFYGWRSETASSTTQRPEYWAPVGLATIALYPRSGASNVSVDVQGYADCRPLTDDAAYLDIEEGHLQKLLGLMQAILSFKQGPVEGTDNTVPLRELFLIAAKDKNVALTTTALYKRYMGQDDSKMEPKPTEAGLGVRS